MQSIRVRRSLGWFTALAVFLGVAALSLWRLGAVDIVSMEGIVADGARTMAATGDWAVPRLHGEIYTFKPPMAYWLALWSTTAFHESEFFLRLPFALSASAMGLAVFWVVGRRTRPGTGLACACAATTGSLTLQKMRMAEFDMPLAAGVGIASVLAMAELTSQRTRAWRWLLAYLALAAAFLAKGIPALMYFCPGLLFAAWWTSSWRRLFRPAHLAGVAAFLLVVGAWGLAAWRAEGLLAFQQPLAEAGVRGFGWTWSAVGRTLLKPLDMLASFLPWSLAVPFALHVKLWRRLPEESRRLGMAAAGFVAGGMLAFCLVPATETRYLLPLAAPIGVLSGMLLTSFPAHRGLRRTIRIFALLVAAMATLAAPGLHFAGELAVPHWSVFAVAVVGAALGLAALADGRSPLEPSGRPLALAVATAACIWFAQVIVIEPHRASSRSLRSVAAEFEPHLPGEGTLWSLPVTSGFHHSSLTFYLRRPMKTLTNGQVPGPGSRLVLYSDEHPELGEGLPFETRLLATATKREYRFALREVVRAEDPTP